MMGCTLLAEDVTKQSNKRLQIALIACAAQWKLFFTGQAPDTYNSESDKALIKQDWQQRVGKHWIKEYYYTVLIKAEIKQSAQPRGSLERSESAHAPKKKKTLTFLHITYMKCFSIHHMKKLEALNVIHNKVMHMCARLSWPTGLFVVCTCRSNMCDGFIPQSCCLLLWGEKKKKKRLDMPFLDFCC